MTVPVVEGAINQPLPTVMQGMRWAAGQAGYALDEAHSGPTWLYFVKGVTMWCWGSQLAMVFAPMGPTSTRISVKTSETVSYGDRDPFGRGRRTTHRLFDAIGAYY